MRKVAVFALAGVMAMGSSFAWAWSDVSGTIDKIDTKTHAIVLDNGQTYMLEKSVKITGLKKGANVTLSWEEQKGKNMVNKLTMEKAEKKG